jgi:hypothetical protein
MYLVSDSVAGEGPEVGRIWAWAPGWFENENVFLHLEHKYLLALRLWTRPAVPVRRSVSVF